MTSLYHIPGVLHQRNGRDDEDSQFPVQCQKNGEWCHYGVIPVTEHTFNTSAPLAQAADVGLGGRLTLDLIPE